MRGVWHTMAGFVITCAGRASQLGSCIHVSAPPRVQSAISWSEKEQHRVLLAVVLEMEQLLTHCGGRLDVWARL